MQQMSAAARGGRLAGVCVLGVVGLAPLASAEDWIEPRSNDAGRVKETALYPEPADGGQPLDAITGELEEFMQGRGVPPSPTDGQDMFAIWIADPANFSAQAVPVPGSSLTDPQLFLFDANGFGLLGSLDVASSDPYPRLLPTADDGTFTLTTPGLYFIAISGASSVPISGSADPIFSFATPTELSGPDGIGGAGVHSEWIGPMTYGQYRIELTGTLFVPAPGAGAIGAVAAAVLLRRRRRR